MTSSWLPLGLGSTYTPGMKWGQELISQALHALQHWNFAKIVGMTEKFHRWYHLDWHVAFVNLQSRTKWGPYVFDILGSECTTPVLQREYDFRTRCMTRSRCRGLFFNMEELWGYKIDPRSVKITPLLQKYLQRLYRYKWILFSKNIIEKRLNN